MLSIFALMVCCQAKISSVHFPFPFLCRCFHDMLLGVTIDSNPLFSPVSYQQQKLYVHTIVRI